MPEFILDHGSPEAARAFNALDSFTQGYIEAMFFTEEDRLCEESQGDHEMPSVAVNLETMESRFVGGNSVSFADLAPSALALMIADCATFQNANAELLDRAYQLGEAQACYDDTCAGRDFWYSRNGHGVGFWDRGLGEVGDNLDKAAKHFRAIDSYLGDDSLIYLA
jgi:hypothetical protein